MVCIEFSRGHDYAPARPETTITGSAVPTLSVDVSMELVLKSRLAWRQIRCKFQGDTGRETISVEYPNTRQTLPLSELSYCFVFKNKGKNPAQGHSFESGINPSVSTEAKVA